LRSRRQAAVNDLEAAGYITKPATDAATATTWAILKPKYRFLEFCAFLDRCVEEAFVAASAHCNKRVSGLP
jgi:hypothetical protein